MTIYELKDLLALTLRDHEVSNGEFIPDATFTLTMKQGKALFDLLEREIDVRRRRASAGGRAFVKGSQLAKDAMAKARAGRAEQLAQKKESA